MGMKERGGRIEPQIVPDVKKATLREVVSQDVEKGSTVSTDELASYGLLKGDGFRHGAVDHSRKEYAWTDQQTGTHFSTNGRSFWICSKCPSPDAYPYLSEAPGSVSWRVFFPLEFSPDAEWDVRSSDCRGLIKRAAWRSNSARSIGPRPCASSWAMNSSSRPDFLRFQER